MYGQTFSYVSFFFFFSILVYDLLTLQINLFPIFQKDDPSSHKEKIKHDFSLVHT